MFSDWKKIKKSGIFSKICYTKNTWSQTKIFWSQKIPENGKIDFLTVPCTTDTYKPAQSTYLAEDYCVVLFQQKKNKIERYRRKIVSFQPQNLFGQSPDDFFPTFESVPVTSETNRPAQTTSLELNFLEKKKREKNLKN